MARKIRVGTDILFNITIHGGMSMRRFNKSIQRVIPMLVSGGGCGHSTHTPTETSTNQCCNSQSPQTSQILTVLSVRKLGKKDSENFDNAAFVVEALYKGETQRNTGPMNLQFTWVEGDLGSERNEQIRFTVDVTEVVTMIGSTDIQDLSMVEILDDGRFMIDIYWAFDV